MHPFPSNDNTSKADAQHNALVGIVNIGLSFSATMNAITTRAKREGWNAEKYGQAINQAMFDNNNA